jgi:proteasome assembly chaperone 3
MGLPQQTIMEDTEVTVPYPAQTRQAAAEISGIKTDVTFVSFSDKIMITITQDGRLAQWVC